MDREIDLAPRHLVDWLRADLARGGPRELEVTVTHPVYFSGSARVEFSPRSAQLVASGEDVTERCAVAQWVREGALP